MEKSMVNIKVLSKQLNISSRTLRYYEELGLINSQKINNQRHYTNEEIEKIEMIILLRKIDLPLSDVKKLIDNYSNENINNIIKNKIASYYKNIATNSKKLHMLLQIENKLNKANEVRDVILSETAKVLNQDEKRIEIIKIFFKTLEQEQYNEISKYLDPKMDISILKKAFIDDMKLNIEEYHISTYSHMSYYNNMIFVKIVKEKTYYIRFIFNDENIIIGIWLDKIN